MSRVGLDLILKGNEKFATADYKAPALLPIALPTLPGAVIITCLDPRVIPEFFANLETDKFPVIRNAGGRVINVERDIGFLSAAVDINDVVIIHHEDCGLWNFDNKAINSALASKGLGEPSSPLDFGEIKDMDQSVRDDVEKLRKSPYLSPKVNIRGYVLDLISSGKLREVVTSWGEGREHI